MLSSSIAAPTRSDTLIWGPGDDDTTFFDASPQFGVDKHEGEHRIPAEKWRPYEADIHLPLLVRGADAQVGSVPEVRAGSTTDKLT
jgi:hypothetical protein